MASNRKLAYLCGIWRLRALQRVHGPRDPLKEVVKFQICSNFLNSAVDLLACPFFPLITPFILHDGIQAPLMFLISGFTVLPT
jgi:hypothetical protein